LSHYPEYVPALIGKGLCLMEKDEMEEAMDCFKNATRIEPDNVLSINYYGETLTHLGRYDEAIHAFNCALETAPESEDVLRNLGRLYLDVGRYEESIVIYNRLLRATQDTDNKYQSFVFLAIAYFKLGDYDFSEQYIRRALEINAQNATQVFFGACPEAMTQFARLFEEKKTDEHDRGETAN
jgi:tetratricopeptide (TPR) repeat protein